MLSEYSYESDAGRYEDEIAYNPETEEYDWRKLLVTCPFCKKRSAPMHSKKTVQLSSGMEWVGCEYQQPSTRHQAACPHCKREYHFRVVTPQ